MTHKLLTYADFNYHTALATRLGDDSQQNAPRLLTRYSNHCAHPGTKKVTTLC